MTNSSSGILNLALKKNNYLNALQSDISNLYVPASSSAGSKVPNGQGLNLNPSVGAAVHRDTSVGSQVAPPKVISCSKTNKSAQRFDYSSI